MCPDCLLEDLLTCIELGYRQAGMSKSMLTVECLFACGLTEAVMIAETISLGILALPSALSTLGLLP